MDFQRAKIKALKIKYPGDSHAKASTGAVLAAFEDDNTAALTDQPSDDTDVGDELTLEEEEMLLNYASYPPDPSGESNMQQTVALLSAAGIPTPLNFKEAMSPEFRDLWEPAIHKEYEGLMANHTWELVDCPPDNLRLVGYADADFAADLLQRRSRGGYLFRLGDHGACSYKSALMPTATQETGGGIAQSTVDAETVSLAHAIKDGIHLKMLVSEILGSPVQPLIMMEDNQGAISCATNAVISDGTKHIDVKWHFVKDHVEAGTVKLAKNGPTATEADRVFAELAHAKFCIPRRIAMPGQLDQLHRAFDDKTLEISLSAAGKAPAAAVFAKATPDKPTPTECAAERRKQRKQAVAAWKAAATAAAAAKAKANATK
eukprot:jgi/Tetstr1/435985/TSEL_024866.t1